MKRVIISAPEAITFESLTTEQQEAIRSVFTQYVQPMPGTIPADGKILIDAVTGDNFNPANIQVLGLPFDIIGLWQWDGISEDTVEVQPLDDAILLAHLPSVKIFDFETGTVLSETPAVLHEPHRFSGWPPVNL
jgi:hypothetical protein